jgi:alpha-beta hydrolase superfamily lysophospholipase
VSDTSVLLIHGAWHGPWCWDDFAHHLTERGHDVRAVRLRGHDGRPGRIWHRIHHYVEDVERAAADCDRPPIPIGHSMGGIVVQKYLERNAAPGAVLMATVAPGEVIRAAARLAVRHPVAFGKATFLLRLGPFVSTPALVRELFFSPNTSQAIVDDCNARLQDESYLAFLDMVLNLARVRPRRIAAPVLVLGAEHDGFFNAGETRRTAGVYRTEPEVFPRMGHDMMLDQGWEDVADRIDAWLRASGSGAPANADSAPSTPPSGPEPNGPG